MAWVKLRTEALPDLLLGQELDRGFAFPHHHRGSRHHAAGTIHMRKEPFSGLCSDFPEPKREMRHVALAFAPLVEPDHQVQSLVHRAGIEAKFAQRPIAVFGHHAQAVRCRPLVPVQSVGLQECKEVIESAPVVLPGELAFNATTVYEGVPQEGLRRLKGPSIMVLQEREALKRTAFQNQVGCGQGKPHMPFPFKSARFHKTAL